MKNIIIIALLGILVTSCVYYPDDRTLSIVESTKYQEVSDCELLGQVFGDSSYYLTVLGLELAKARAKHQAADIGATNVYWSELSARGFPRATGRAYRCDSF